MAAIGLRELKNHFSQTIRKVEAGIAFDVTDRGRVVARLTPAIDSTSDFDKRLAALIKAGVVSAPVQSGLSTLEWHDDIITRRPGLAAELINEDRARQRGRSWAIAFVE